MSADAKEILRESEYRKKALGLSRGFEPSHHPFSLPRGYVGDFGLVIRIDVVDLIHPRHDRAMSLIIASEFVGD